MDDKTRLNAATDGHAAKTLEELTAEVARIRKQASGFDAHAMWSDKELKLQQRQLRFMHRRTRILTGVAAGLGAVLIVGTVWTQVRIDANEAALATLPDPETFVHTVENRVDAFADQLSDLKADGEIMTGFADRIARLEDGTATRFDELRAHADQASRIEAEARLDVANRLDEMGPRLRAIEVAGQQAEAERVQLQLDVENVRADVGEELALLKFGTSESLLSAESRIAGTERGLEAVSWEIGRQRLDFELFEDYRLEVAPGIVLNISDVDVAYQKVDGWLHMVNDGRILRIDGQPIQQSLVFYGPNDERSYELVFTRVRPDLAVGYLRVPDEDGVRVVNQVRDPDFDSRATAMR